MSITYRQLSKDTNDIIQTTKKRYSDKYEMVMETRNQLEKYYAANGKKIDKSILLRKHKALTSDSDVINSNMVGIMFALIGSAMYEMLDVNTISSDSKSTALFQLVTEFVVMTLLITIVAIITLMVIRYVSKHVYGYERVYIDTFHSDIVYKLAFSENDNASDQPQHGQERTKKLRVKCSKKQR